MVFSRARLAGPKRAVRPHPQINIAVVDVKTLKVTAKYDLAGKGGGPAGLSFDAKNRILAFAYNLSAARFV